MQEFSFLCVADTAEVNFPVSGSHIKLLNANISNCLIFKHLLSYQTQKQILKKY